MIGKGRDQPAVTLPPAQTAVDAPGAAAFGAVEAGRKLFAAECQFIWAAAKSDNLPPIGAPEFAFAEKSRKTVKTTMAATIALGLTIEPVRSSPSALGIRAAAEPCPTDTA